MYTDKSKERVQAPCRRRHFYASFFCICIFPCSSVLLMFRIFARGANSEGSTSAEKRRFSKEALECNPKRINTLEARKSPKRQDYLFFFYPLNP